MVLRKANYAGSWYPGNPESLRSDLDKYFSKSKFGPGEIFKCQDQDKRTIIGGVSGHA